MNFLGFRLRCIFRLILLVLGISFIFFNSSLAFSEDAVDFIFMHSGISPQSGDLDGLKTYMLDHPEYVEELSRKGYIRIVINSKQGSSSEQLQRAESIKQKISQLFEEVGIDLKKRGVKRFLFKPISVSFIPVDLDSRTETISNKVKKDIEDYEEEEKFEKMFSEFNCSDVNSCVDNSFKKLIVTNELIEKRIKEITDKTQEQYSINDIDDISKKEVQTFFKSIRQEDRILILQILSHNFSQPMSNIVEVFELENIEGINKDLIEDIENKVSKQLDQNFSINTEKNKKLNTTNTATSNLKKSSFLNNLLYIPVALAKSLRVPFKDLSVSEMFQGLLPKTLAMAGAISVYSATYQNIPWAWWMAISIYLFQSGFHSIESSGWMDFQNRIKQEKGERFQKKFNMGYSLMWIMLYRSIAYASGNIPNFIGIQNGFISLQWLISMYIIQIVSINISTRGYNALNDLHYKQGVVDKRSRDFLKQWIRDALNAVCGAFIGTGGENNVLMFLVFAVGLLIDESFWVVSQTVNQAPILIVGDKTVVASEDIKIIYPHLKDSTKAIPIKGMGLSKALKTSIHHFIDVVDYIFRPLTIPVTKGINACTRYFNKPRIEESDYSPK